MPDERRRDVRETLRIFAPDSLNPRLVRWSASLEQEQGRGMRIGLLDSGICRSHPVFEGAWIQGRDFTLTGSLFDPTGHGTKNAALLVGQGGHGIKGIAPAAELLLGKVMGNRGEVNERVVARGIRWAVAERAEILILPFGRITGSTLVTHEIRHALSEGVRIFAAAGNRGPEIILYPARLRGVRAISAAELDGRPLSWCCQAREVAYYAPGRDVWTIGPGGIAPVSGSSPATVLAAGVEALRLAQHATLGA